MSKLHDKNSARGYLPKILFVRQRDNGPLGFKNYYLNTNFGLKWTKSS